MAQLDTKAWRDMSKMRKTTASLAKMLFLLAAVNIIYFIYNINWLLLIINIVYLIPAITTIFSKAKFDKEAP